MARKPAHSSLVEQSTDTEIMSSKSQQSSDLAECVTVSVRRYLMDLDGQLPDNLLQLVMEEVEGPLLREVMRWTDGNQCKAAQALGINRGTLRRRLVKYDLL